MNTTFKRVVAGALVALFFIMSCVIVGMTFLVSMSLFVLSAFSIIIMSAIGAILVTFKKALSLGGK